MHTDLERAIKAEAEVKRLRKERNHFARVAWWFAEHEPGTPVPEWCELGWCNGEPQIEAEHVAMSALEAIEVAKKEAP